MRNKEGFTLIESIVAMCVSSVIAGALGLVISLFYTRINLSTVRCRIQMDRDLISEQIGLDIRRSHLIMGPNEDPTSLYSNNSSGPEIDLYDATSPVPQQTGGYRIENNLLQEWKNGQWSNFTLGQNHTVQLTNSSNFYITPNRRYVTLNLAITYTFQNTTDIMLSHGDFYVCKN